MSAKELGQLGSGEYVFDRPRSHLHGDVASVLAEALSLVYSGEREVIAAQVDLGRVVGQKTCVETFPGDEIVFAQRPGRKGPTRFVRGRSAEDSCFVSVVLKRDTYSDWCYVCLSAYVGTLSEPEPWDAFATPESAAFWRNHAMVWGTEEVV